jgi:hypothetical protein
MKARTLLLIAVIIVSTVIIYYFVFPLLIQEKYEARVQFEILEDIDFEGRTYYIGNSMTGSFELETGDILNVDVVYTPVGGSSLQYTYLFLRRQGDGEVVDVSKVTLTGVSKLKAPYDNTYSLSVGVIHSHFFEPEKAVGVWELNIRVQR